MKEQWSMTLAKGWLGEGGESWTFGMSARGSGTLRGLVAERHGTH